MLVRIVRSGLAAATLIAGAALIPTAATAGGAHGGGSGNWPQQGTWNWPEGAQPGCTWTQVRHINHGNGKTYTHWTRLCP